MCWAEETKPRSVPDQAFSRYDKHEAVTGATNKHINGHIPARLFMKKV